jgi:hypothetical protein
METPVHQKMVAAMRVLKSSKGVMFAAAQQSIQDVVAQCFHPDVIELLVQAALDKHPSIRESAIRFIGQAFAVWPRAAWEPKMVIVEDALRRCISDAALPVRTEGRNTYAMYIQKYPNKGLAFFGTLDASAQKKLEVLNQQVNKAPTAEPLEVLRVDVPPAKCNEIRDATPIRINTAIPQDVELGDPCKAIAVAVPFPSSTLTATTLVTPAMQHIQVKEPQSPVKPVHHLERAVGEDQAAMVTPALQHPIQATEPLSPVKDVNLFVPPADVAEPTPVISHHPVREMPEPEVDLERETQASDQTTHKRERSPSKNNSSNNKAKREVVSKEEPRQANNKATTKGGARRVKAQQTSKENNKAAIGGDTRKKPEPTPVAKRTRAGRASLSSK